VHLCPAVSEKYAGTLLFRANINAVVVLPWYYAKSCHPQPLLFARSRAYHDTSIGSCTRLLIKSIAVSMRRVTLGRQVSTWFTRKQSQHSGSVDRSRAKSKPRRHARCGRHVSTIITSCNSLALQSFSGTALFAFVYNRLAAPVPLESTSGSSFSSSQS
jgi:hypothetical protein